MKKLNYLWSVLLVLALPVMIMLLSANAVLRVSETYVYHFNDSQAVDELYTEVTGGQFAKEITSYFNSVKSKDFQVYEKNGRFKDAFFDKADVKAMRYARKDLNLSLGLALVTGALGVGSFVYLYRKRYIKNLKISGYVAAGITSGYIVLMNILVRSSGFRKALYGKFIGVSLNKKSALDVLLGGNFYKSFLIFETVTAAVMVGVLIYLTYSFTKEKRMFS